MKKIYTNETISTEYYFFFKDFNSALIFVNYWVRFNLMNLRTIIAYQGGALLMVLCLAPGLTSCISDPKSHEAIVGNAQQVKEITSKALSYVIDGETSEVTWVGTKPTGRHNGTIPIIKGEISTEENEIIGGSISMDLNQIDIRDLPPSSEDHIKLTNHLKSIDFFDVTNYPKAVFEITEISDIKNEDEWVKEVGKGEFVIEDPSHLVEGNLTMKNTTLGITFPAKIEFSDNRISATARFNIDRTKWGISYNQESKFVDKAKDGLIYNTVNVGFTIKAKSKK